MIIKSFFLLPFFILIINSGLPAQEKLYIPRNIQSAYSKETRSMDGSPGKNYWQNSAEYIIEAELKTDSRLLTGKEKIRYFNNSPDSLYKIVIRLYQDFYKPASARDFEITPDFFTKGIILKSFIYNGQKMDLTDNKRFLKSGVNLSLVPDLPVAPNSTSEFEIEWSFTVPLGTPVRMGTYDASTFFIAYWYPQIAVYDDISGWDEINFGGEKEFYNDFNSYDCRITVPSTSGIWATGVLQNPEEVLNKIYLERYNQAHISDSVIKIITKEDLGKVVYNQTGEKITWHFIADKTTDFTFATSSHYLWDAVSIKPDPLNEKRSLISAVYPQKSKDFFQVAEMTKKALTYFSEELPGVPYPFPSLTIFNGSGGMEFPMMINNGSEPTYSSTFRLLSHEIAHQYFPFFVGTNEKKYAWMDEGMAVMLPFDLQESNGHPSRRLNVDYYLDFAGNETEVPPMQTSINSTGKSYRVSSYTRPGIAYDVLRGVMGKEIFKEAMQLYFSEWKEKHPIPYDFFFLFNQAAGEDLSWFWEPWFFNPGYPDLAIKNVIQESDQFKITIEKKGSIPVPVHITLWGSEGQKHEIRREASDWKNITETTIQTIIPFIITDVELGNKNIPDVDQSNNYYNLIR